MSKSLSRGPGDIARWIKCLLCKWEGHNLGSPKPYKSQKSLTANLESQCLGDEGRESWGKLATYITRFVRAKERSYPSKQNREWLKKILSANPQPPHTYTHVGMCTHSHANMHEHAKIFVLFLNPCTSLATLVVSCSCRGRLKGQGCFETGWHFRIPSR